MSSEVARVLQEINREAWLKSKARNKHKRRGFWWQNSVKAVEEEHIVTPDEVIREIERLGGPKISRSILLLWEREGLIPAATRGSHGRGKGRYTDYPPETPYEGLAAARLLREGIPADPLSDDNTMVKLTFKEVRSARHIGMAAIEGPIPVQNFAPYRLATLRRKALGELAEWRRRWRRAQAVHPGGFGLGRIGDLWVLARLWKVLTLYHGFKWAATFLAAQEQRLREASPGIVVFSIPPRRTYAAVAFNFPALKKTLVVGGQKLGVDAGRLKGKAGFLEIQ